MRLPGLWVVAVVASAAWCVPAMGEGIVYDDVWDVSQGASVTGNSPTLSNSAAANMIGGSYGIESNNLLFSDSYGPGTIHWVEWMTLSPVTIRRFNLVASHEDPVTRRSFDHFSLYAWSGADWVALYDQDVPLPYGGGPTYATTSTLELNEAVAAVMSADKFRAEFRQYGNVPSARGPRIQELDGSEIPEPASVALIGLGIVAATGRRRRGRR
jgi:hypothetical protein